MISVAGSQMQVWALLWQVRSLSDQPIVVSGIGAVRFLPILVFSLVGKKDEKTTQKMTQGLAKTGFRNMANYYTNGLQGNPAVRGNTFFDLL